MGRPRKYQSVPVVGHVAPAPAPRRAPEPPPLPPPPPPAPSPANDLPTMYAVDSPEIDATPFGRVTTKWQRWRLVREGKLPSVHVGRRVYITADAIREFIAKGGAK